jgi:hypothetical protein
VVDDERPIRELVSLVLHSIFTNGNMFYLTNECIHLRHTMKALQGKAFEVAEVIAMSLVHGGLPLRDWLLFSIIT